MGLPIGVVLLAAVVLAGSLAGIGSPALPAGAPSPAPFGPHFAHAIHAHPPGLRPVGAAGGAVWYTQVGATLSEVNGSSSTSELKDLIEQITLVASSYPIGYELNGISSTGDWYQVVLSDNWNGCVSGFAMVYEVWDNAGATQSPVCDYSLSMSAGDSVVMSVNFTGRTLACLRVNDLTSLSAKTDCVSEPDSGASGFELLSSGANSFGYFTGPMTEVGNPTPSSCPNYSNLPTLEYRWPSEYHIEGFVPFSDEFEYGGSNAFCWSSGDSEIVIGAGDPTTHSVDTTQGTGYHAHYVAGQNLSFVDAQFGTQLLTDAAPLASVTVQPLNATLSPGAQIELNATISGGTAPYSGLWSIDGIYSITPSPHLFYNATVVGLHTVAAYGVDADRQVVGPATASIDVPGRLAVGPLVFATGRSGADIGESTTLGASVAGGFPPYSFVWSGLPAGCISLDSGTVPCVPAATGTFVVGLAVTDTNGTTVDALPLSVTVAPEFVPTLSISRLSLDVGQAIWVNVTPAGGLGPYQYTWTGIPVGCAPPPGASLGCAPTAAGTIELTANVTDSNGVSVPLSAPSVTVTAGLVAELSADRVVADAGVPIALQVSATGGLAPIGFAWSGLPAGCQAPPNAASVTCAFGAGTSTVSVNVTDANDAVFAVPPVNLGIFPALNGSLAGGGTYASGAPITLVVDPVGGAGDATLAWEDLPAGCSPPSGLTLRCTPTSPGDYNVTVVLSDSGGGQAALTVHLVVASPASNAPGSADLDLPVLLLVLLVVLVGAGIVTIAAVAARRRR